MANTSSLSLDHLRIGWKRAKLDRPARCFITHPFLFDLIEKDLDAWLSDLQNRLVNNLVPQDPLHCPVPKGNWMLRPATILPVADEVIYNALIAANYEAIHEKLLWSQGTVDTSYQLIAPDGSANWIKRSFECWSDFTDVSKERLDSGAIDILVLDIAGFYDNIDIDVLLSDLQGANVPPQYLTIFKSCLLRWSRPKGRGIPQGYSASDILAKLYLNSIDQALQNGGFVHVRYVDDIKVFCANKLAAKRALAKISALFRDRGLQPQSTKTEILSREDALRQIEGVLPTIQGIQSQLQKELEQAVGYEDGYATVESLQRAVEQGSAGPSIDIIVRAFEERFVQVDGRDFDRTLFHYLLTRLSTAKSPVAIKFCLDALRSHPEETAYILRYLASTDLCAEDEERILAYCSGPEAIYDYQLYQIAKWYYDRGKSSAGLLTCCRTWLADQNKAPWLRTYALAILGRDGNDADREAIESGYNSLPTELSRAEAIVALGRVQTGRRDRFYGAHENDGELVKRAISYIKGQN